MEIIMAIILGLLFGFVLQKVGAANPKIIMDMLRLKEFHLIKVISLGIGASSLVLFALLGMGLIDAGHLSIKASFVGVLVGGAIFGVGWAVSGFCPGSGVVAVGAGRKDALFFILGGLVGAFLLTLMYESLKATFLFNELGGKTVLVTTENDKYTAIFSSLPAFGVAGIIAVIFIVFAWKLPEKKGL